MIDLGKQHKPCKHGHDSPHDSRGCAECHRISGRKYDKTPNGKKSKTRANIKRVTKEAKERGINGDIRREIENRRLDKELEDLLNA